MKVNIITLSSLSMVFLTLAILSACDNPAGSDSDPNRPDNDTLELIAPDGGGTYNVGDTVKIKYKVNAKIISSCELKVVLFDGGASTYNIIQGSLASDSLDTGDKFITLTYDWVIGNEYEYWAMEEDGKEYISEGTDAKVEVKEYNGDISVRSSSNFTVTSN